MPALGRQRLKKNQLKARLDYRAGPYLKGERGQEGNGKEPGTFSLLLKPWSGAAEPLQESSLAEKADGF